MPYILDRREELTPYTAAARKSGELNFQFTQIIIQYLRDNGKGYSQFNDILGALEGAKLEFYRRVVVPYEEQKIAENGDVF